VAEKTKKKAASYRKDMCDNKETREWGKARLTIL
jgi:hypothetical protein